MKKIFALLLSVAMVTSLFVGVAFAAAPTVTFYPITAATNVAVSVNPTITFNVPVRFIDDRALTTVLAWTGLSLERVTAPAAAVPFTVTIGQNDTVLTVVPSSPLVHGVQYRLTVREGAFESVLSPHTAVATTSTLFTTVATPAVTGVTFSTPLRLDDNLTITFAQAIRDAATDVTPTGAHLSDNSRVTLATAATPLTLLPVTGTIAGDVITLNPTSNLVAGTEYIISVLAGAFENNAAPHTAVPLATATFTVAGRTGNAITSYPLAGNIGVNINSQLRTVRVFMPLATTLSGLAATLATDVVASPGASVVLTTASAGTWDFDTAAVYTVTAENGTAVTWNVFVAHPLFLNASVSGTPALGGSVAISGSINDAMSIATSRTYRLAVQRRAFTPDATWGNVVIHDVVIGASVASAQFNFIQSFTEAGDYRLAIVDGDVLGTARAISITGVTTTHTIGTIAEGALTVTPSITDVTWGLDGKVTVPLTISHLDAAGNVVHITDPALVGLTALYGATTVPSANIATGVRRAGTNIIDYTFTNPGTMPTGVLAITVTQGAIRRGTASVNLVQRGALNATVTPSPAFAVGTATNLTVVPFDLAGRKASETGAGFAYTITTVTGPFAAQLPVIRTTTADVTFASLTPRHGGTVTTTVVFYDAGHNVIQTLVREFTVAGPRIELPATVVRRNDVTTLRAIVTDAAGNRINNARVTFHGAANMFATRNALGTFVNVADTALPVTGLLATQPAGRSVINGEYSVDVTLRAVGNIRVQVETPTLHADGVQIIWTTVADWTNAIVVAPTLGYTVTVDHTLLAGLGVDEVANVTVRDTAGVAITSGVVFSSNDPTLTAVEQLVVSGGIHVGAGVWRVPLRIARAGTRTLTVTNTAGTIAGTATITAVAPVVAVTPDGGLLTTDFNDTITVTVTDPRTNTVISLPIAVAQLGVLAPNEVSLATATVRAIHHRAVGATSWTAASSFTASSQQFRINAAPTAAAARTIAGVVQAPQVRVSVASGAANVDLALANATIAVTPAEFTFGRRSTATVRILNARGTAIAGTIVVSGAASLAATDVTADGLSLEVTPVAVGTGGVINPSHVRFTVTPVLPTGVTTPVTTDIVTTVPVVAAPADTVAPVITTNAPATTTAASVQVTISATDDVGVTRIIVDGVEVVVLPAATQAVVRNLPLVVGGNTFVVQAADAAGNVVTQTITITRTAPPAPPADTAAPIIEVTVPAVTTEATAVVTVTVRDAVNIAANGIIFDGAVIPGFVSREQIFTRTVNLREGMNIFTVAAQDAAGNVATRTIAVERRTPPAPVSHVITIGRANPAIGLDVPANVRNGRLMVPFRWFGERILEATVDYRVVGTAEIVTLVKGNISVELTLNSTIAKVNGTPVSLDVAAFATGGRTLVPARFLAETFGYTVNWNPADDSVTISKR